MAKSTSPSTVQAQVVVKQTLSGKSLTVAQFQDLQRRAQELDNLPEWERDRALDTLLQTPFL
jgi:hypothetical protein